VSEGNGDYPSHIGDPWILSPPGLNGSYTDSCIVCMRGTDTGLAFVAPADEAIDWAVAGLMALGVPNDRASTIVTQALERIAAGEPPQGVLRFPDDGSLAFGFRVCGDCADRSPANPRVGFITEGVPAITRPT
jgi:hypothetical protein